MSILDELLVAIDDQTELRLDQLQAIFPQHSRTLLCAALGRLGAWGWIEKVARGRPIFRVTQSGNTYLDQVLSTIRTSERTWPENWFMVAVILPEKNRQLRDRLRHYFLNQGYGRLLDGLWIYPWNRQAELSTAMAEYGASAGVINFETQSLGQGTNQLLIRQAWNWPNIERRFHKFLDETRPRLNGLTQLSAEARSPEARLRLRLAAKAIVFEYGQLLGSGPNLPNHYSPARTLQSAARTLYDQVRPFCYR